MRTHLMRWLAVAGLVVPVIGSALDSPHDRNGTTTACSACHSLYNPSASGATDYSSACLSCHSKYGERVAWDASTEAVAGTSGTSHAWSKMLVNPAFGSINRLSARMQGLLVDGKLQCVICHDPHTTAVTARPGSMYTSFKVGEPRTITNNLLGDLSGSATLTLTATPGAWARGFRIKIQSLRSGGGSFIISHDYGWSQDSWLKYEGGAWTLVGKDVDAAGNPITGRDFSDGVAVPLDTGGASVTISANGRVGDYWDFFITYPFLRYSNVTDGWCVQCHQPMEMNHLRARGVDTNYLPNGVKKFSHPVGITLDANKFGTDRLAPLDADGSAGSSGADGLEGTTAVANPTNDVVLKGGVVTCTSCHAPHNADSNSLTVDAH